MHKSECDKLINKCFYFLVTQEKQTMERIFGICASTVIDLPHLLQFSRLSFSGAKGSIIRLPFETFWLLALCLCLDILSWRSWSPRWSIHRTGSICGLISYSGLESRLVWCLSATGEVSLVSLYKHNFPISSKSSRQMGHSLEIKDDAYYLTDYIFTNFRTCCLCEYRELFILNKQFLWKKCPHLRTPSSKPDTKSSKQIGHLIF